MANVINVIVSKIFAPTATDAKRHTVRLIAETKVKTGLLTVTKKQTYFCKVSTEDIADISEGDESEMDLSLFTLEPFESEITDESTGEIKKVTTIWLK